MVKFDSEGSVVWTPQVSNEGNGYARVIQLQHAGDANGKLLATWEHWYTDGNTKNTNKSASNYIIRESSDWGTTWDTLATISDPQTDPGHPSPFFYQPFFFEFPQQLGKYPEGTLLLTWNAVGKWQYGSKDETGRIWEPFLFLDSEGRLVAVFSDQRDYWNHAQMLVHVVSEDGGDTWGEVVQDVVGDEQIWRPGMATVAKMDNGKFFMSYEWCNDTDTGKPCPIHVKTSSDGVTWNPNDPGTVISTPDGVQPFGSLYTIWDPAEKQLIVSSRAQRWASDISTHTPENERVVLVNKDHGKGDWSWASSPWRVPASTDVCGANYSPHLLLLPDGTIRYTTQASIDAANSKSHCALRTGAAPIATLPYNSNFSTNGQAGWIDFDGDWSISDDQYQFAPVTDTATIALTGSSGWTDYEISADVIITSNSGVVGLVARASASKSAPNSLSRYTVAIDSNRGDLTVYRVTDQATPLQSKAHPGGIQANKYYNLSLSVQSTKIMATLSEDGGSNTTVTSTGDGLKSGLAGLYGSYGGGGFKNVQISSLA